MTHLSKSGLLILLLVFAAVAKPVRANPGPIAEILCAPTGQIETRLQSQFRSERLWQGLRSPDEIMELWEDEAGGWTLVIARSGGTSCIVAMGEGLSPYADFPQG